MRSTNIGRAAFVAVAALALIGHAGSHARKASPKVAVADGQAAFVKKIIDGDTIDVRLLPSGESVRVRIKGIDCPESHKNSKCKKDGQAGRKDCEEQVPLGLKAAKRAHKLLDETKIRLESSRPNKTFEWTFDRLLAYVRMVDGRDFGLVMVKEGLCEDFGWKYPHPRGKEYEAAQKTGQAE